MRDWQFDWLCPIRCLPMSSVNFLPLQRATNLISQGCGNSYVFPHLPFSAVTEKYCWLLFCTLVSPAQKLAQNTAQVLLSLSTVD